MMYLMQMMRLRILGKWNILFLNILSRIWYDTALSLWALEERKSLGVHFFKAYGRTFGQER
jgi:hypothetical protein